MVDVGGNPQNRTTLYTDASQTGWLAHFHELTAAKKWSSSEIDRYINHLEAKVVLLAFTTFQERIKGLTIIFVTDNASVLAYLNKLGYSVNVTLSDVGGDLDINGK